MEIRPTVSIKKTQPTDKLEFFVADENIKILQNNLQVQPVLEGKEIELTEIRRKVLLGLLIHLPELSIQLLTELKKLANAEGFEVRKMALHLVGGRVRNEPVKDTSDFDLVISTDNPLLNPLGKNEGAIKYPVRHKIIRALNEIIQKFLEDKGYGSNEENGLVEIKGLSNNSLEEMVTAEKTATENGGFEVMKIVEATNIERKLPKVTVWQNLSEIQKILKGTLAPQDYLIKNEDGKDVGNFTILISKPKNRQARAYLNTINTNKERGKGYGRSAYIEIIELLKSQGITFSSSEFQISRDAKKVWDWLVAIGKARKVEEGITDESKENEGYSTAKYEAI